MSENKQTTDSELLLQIVGYNSDAFEQLYSRYSAAIYSLIKEIVTSPKLAEKILLNVFSVFLKRIDYYSTTSNDIFTWLTLLSRNISIDALKRMKSAEDIPEYSDEYEIEFILPNLSQLITPINLDERTVHGEKIKSYKSHLSEIQNLVLSLVYFEGLDEDEIAKRLSVPIVTVRQKILSIMESLHHQYTGKIEDAKSNQKDLTLIKLDALGCLSSEERALLNGIRENDPDFLWKELGEYQNLTALLSTSIPVENPRPELSNEIKNIFTNILQGSELDYPVLKPGSERNKQYSESTSNPEVIVEKYQNSNPEPVQQQTKTATPEAIKPPEIQEKKKPEFVFKFKERDPKELSLLKKIETPELDQSTSSSFAKSNSDIKIKDYNEIIKKPALVVSKKEELPAAKESISIASKTEHTILDKTVSADINKSEMKIENNDPSIIIDKPKPELVKEEVVIKNRLIPNSSINLKEFFKKEDKTLINKGSNTYEIKEENKAEENPVSPFVSKSDIVIKSNEPPKELRRSNVFVNKSESILGSKPGLPTIDKSGIANKISELSKETQKTITAIVKEENKVEENPVVPVIAKSDIKIKTNEPPKEFRRSNVFVDKDPKTVLGKPAAPIIEKSEFENKKIEQVREFKQTDSIVAKAGKPEESKIPRVEKKPDISTAIQAPINQKEKIVSEVKRSDNIQEQNKPAIDRSNLKIRETVFTENDKSNKSNKPGAISPVVELKPSSDKANPASTLIDPINIDEILSKIEDEKPAPGLINEAESYEKEIITLRKKLRRNILISAAMFIILVASAIFVYLSFQETPVKVVNKSDNSEKVNLAGQTSIVLNNDYKPEIETEKLIEPSENIVSEKPLNNQNVVIPPLPEISTKEESTLFASNVNHNLASIETKEITQIAAAKTENIVPPKEEKIVEEEPAFFVAVEQMPELIGGLKGIQSQIKYPEIAKRVGVEGKVLVQAIVDETGNVISVNTIKGIGAGCDEVALDAVRNSKFVPGKQRGKNVKVQVTIPIVFKK